MFKMASITFQVVLVLALFTTYCQAGGNELPPDPTDAPADNKQCQNSFPNGGLGLLAKVYERVSKLEMEIKKTKERLGSCGCGGGDSGGLATDAPVEQPTTVDENVLGCADLAPDHDMWIARTGDTIEMGCYGNNNIWQLSCQGGQWVGDWPSANNCTQAVP